MPYTGRTFASATTLAAVLLTTAPATHADVRVWTDQEEVILKGTLLGIETLPDATTAAPESGTVAAPAREPAGNATLIPPADTDAAPLRTIDIGAVRALYDAVANAEPGDRIVLAPGEYLIDRNSIALKRPGSAAHPIAITSDLPHTATLRMTGQNGFLISAPYWIVENLAITGACETDDVCEHAFHIVGGADRTTVRNNRILDFNAPIKSNGVKDNAGWLYPDFGLIDGNDIFNTRPRDTANPVTGIDVVGGQGWIIRDNYLADFVKAKGNGISYAAFLKGGSTDGLFERNLVICRRKVAGGTRVGLSFGGGGTDLAKFCAGPQCYAEHSNGTMRNNIVLACNDEGIYLNRAANSQIHNNMLYDTRGINVRFAESTGDIRNNILSGSIRLRDGATSERRNNVIAAMPTQFSTWFANPGRGDFTLVNRNFFVDKGEEVPGLAVDFCGNERRAGPPDIGAIEFSRSCNVDDRLKRVAD